MLDLQTVSNASKLRLILTEPNLHRKNLQQDIEVEWAKGTDYLQGNGLEGTQPWQGWYGAGILASIYGAEDDLREIGINRGSIPQRVESMYPGKEWRVRKHHLQRETMKLQEANGKRDGGCLHKEDGAPYLRKSYV